MLMREFEVAAGRAAFTANDNDIPFKLGDDVLNAKAPTTGQLTLFFRGGHRGGLRSIESLMEFFSDVLDDKDWRIVENQLRDGMDIAVLSDISAYLIGEWSGRPTLLPSVSTQSPNGTGPKSTAKRAAKASTS
jgi:hypothetical protein